MTTILENEQLLEGLVQVESPEELSALFAQHNIQLEDGLTAEEAFQLIQEQASRDLDEVALENVTGGSISLGVAIGAAGCFVLGAAVICFIGGYAYQKYQNSKKKKKK